MTSSCGGEEMANFLGRISPEFRGYTYSFVNKYHPWSWCWWCWCWMNLMTLIKKTIKGRWAWNVSYHFYNRTNRDISLECLTQFGGEELQEVLKDAGITNAVHRYWLEYGKRCFWREKGVQGYQLSISIIGIRFSQSLVLSFFNISQTPDSWGTGWSPRWSAFRQRASGGFAKHSNPKPHNRVKIPQSDLGSPEAQYDVYLTHPHGQVAVFAHFHNGMNFAVPLKWVEWANWPQSWSKTVKLGD